MKPRPYAAPGAGLGSGTLRHALLCALLGIAGCGGEPQPELLRASISLNGDWEAAPVR